MKRTATCGELTAADAGRRVTLNGWVHRNRDHGAIQFIDLRDRYGVTQVVIDPLAMEKTSPYHTIPPGLATPPTTNPVLETAVISG